MAPIERGEARAAVALSAFGLEPMFAIWPADALAAVQAAVEEGRSSPREVLRSLGAARVAFQGRTDVDPFANLNTPEDVAAARVSLARAP